MGESEESVSCEATEYGCCRNQVDAATGPNFEGCGETVQGTNNLSDLVFEGFHGDDRCERGFVVTPCILS